MFLSIFIEDIQCVVRQVRTATNHATTQYEAAVKFDNIFYLHALARNVIKIIDDYYISNLNPTWKIGAKDAVSVFRLETSREHLLECASGLKIKKKHGVPEADGPIQNWTPEHEEALNAYIDKIIKYLQYYQTKCTEVRGVNPIAVMIRQVNIVRNNHYPNPHVRFLELTVINNINELFHSELLYYYDVKAAEPKKKRKIFSYNAMCNNCSTVGHEYVSECEYYNEHLPPMPVIALH
jgi:hypothetical protein